MLYFAYGANMDEERIQAENRCPDARFIFNAVLPGYRLVFASRTEAGTIGADVAVDHGSRVWGVVYDITESDRQKLDAREAAARRAHRPKEVLVHPHGDLEQRVMVLTYTVNDPTQAHQPPTREYLDYLLRGARRWGLPAAYIAQLERIEVAG